MKTKFSTLLAVLALTIGPAAFAADKDAKPADKKDTPKQEKCTDCKDCKECKCKAGECKCDDTEKPKTVMLTGSHIPQRVTRIGRITDGISPVIVLTSADLEATGETDLAAALRKAVPSFH